ncbi:unnamed protein product [Pleuronectes platessa]|uniref:Uncharacterized protein n=1 Tax=Pleuronectes platessa TaxID=8262 RepID=A0A9N7VUE0_PLEPL|nr:unnamed protein product [Pleuronectes platessa]
MFHSDGREDDALLRVMPGLVAPRHHTWVPRLPAPQQPAQPLTREEERDSEEIIQDGGRTLNVDVWPTEEAPEVKPA